VGVGGGKVFWYLTSETHCYEKIQEPPRFATPKRKNTGRYCQRYKFALGFVKHT